MSVRLSVRTYVRSELARNGFTGMEKEREKLRQRFNTQTLGTSNLQIVVPFVVLRTAAGRRGKGIRRCIFSSLNNTFIMEHICVEKE